MVSGLSADGPSFSPDQIAFFTKEVRPLLEANCMECHGGVGKNGKVKIRGEFQIISRRGILKGGGHGSAYNADNPGESHLLKMISYADEEHQMPPKGKLEAEQITTLTKWVEMGLPWTPADQDLLRETEATAKEFTKVNERTRSHWSYRPLTRPEMPKVSDPEWAGNPIDAFLYARLQKEGIVPNGLAEPRALIRRAFANLTGLPPTPEQMESLASNFNESSWKALVEELLASPSYGEKWARHWLDVVRYADSNGFERDGEKPHIWRYRDYVIDAFNKDKPYDQFIREQLAGDELNEVTPTSLIATGYHRLMQWDDEPSDPQQYRYDVLDDNVKTTSEAFLGMTMGCARCHDHKGDPISQREYYSFMAFFTGVTNMDLSRTIQAVGHQVTPEEIAKERAARNTKLEEMEAELAEGLKQAKLKLAEKSPAVREIIESNGKASVLLADSRLVGQEWAYTTETPEDHWWHVGYQPKNWKQGQAPFGQDLPGCRSKWEGNNIWLQKTFQITTVPKTLAMRIFHDEDAEVYLNGQLIFQGKGFTTRYRFLPLDAKAAQALQTGRNVVTVHCKHSVGGRFIDLGLETGLGPDQIFALLREQGQGALPKEGVQRLQNLRREWEKLRSAPLEAEVKAMTVQETGSKPEEMFIHRRGSVHAPGDPAPPAFPEILGGGEPKTFARSNPKTSGRRRVLADWIASRDNRRTARVMVNRLWQHHFGRGLCPTPNDFGFLGQEPQHAELLDWLACEFMDRGWSIKEMQRLILSSRAFRLSSAPNEASHARDPQNLYHWRMDMRRLNAEEIRDAMLCVTGQINRKIGGESFFLKLPAEVIETASTKEGKWGQSPPEEQNRRSIYIKIKRSLQPPELMEFDFADTDASCAARFATTVPTQALAMLNSASTNEHAEKLAARLAKEQSTWEARIRRGIELVTTRPARSEEIALCQALIRELQDRHKLSEKAALERFCLMALNLNEFIYVD